jgi:hypothetical protein
MPGIGLSRCRSEPGVIRAVDVPNCTGYGKSQFNEEDVILARLQVEMFSCLSDNYGFLIHDDGSGMTAAIDSPEAARINEALERKGWQLTHILNTHHHFDHAGGNLELQSKWQCTIIGASDDAARIPGIDQHVKDEESFDLGGHKVVVLDVSGHTQGHIAYYLPDDGVLFSGDALFADEMVEAVIGALDARRVHHRTREAALRKDGERPPQIDGVTDQGGYKHIVGGRPAEHDVGGQHGSGQAEGTGDAEDAARDVQLEHQ